MTKIITCGELRYRTLDELEALFRTLQIEFGRTPPGSPERGIVVANLENVRRAMAAARLSRQEAAVHALARGLGPGRRPRRSIARVAGQKLHRPLPQPAREDAARGATDRWRHVCNLMGNRAPNTDTGEPETSSDALLDELVRALARQAAERDYAALRNEPRSPRRRAGGKKESR